MYHSIFCFYNLFLMHKILCVWAVCMCIGASVFAQSLAENFNNSDNLLAFNAVAGSNGAVVRAGSASKADGEGLDSLGKQIERIVKQPSLPPKSLILPGALIGYGAASFVFKKLNTDVNEFGRKTMWKEGRGDGFIVDHYLMFAPGISVYALNLAGVKGEHRLGDATAIWFVSSAICNGLTFGTKSLTGVMRPDESDPFSFPSGHTSQAFATAEFMRLEYRNHSAWYGIGAYSVAVATGALRMYHDKHWLSDVIAGAGVGILSTRLSYWMYPRIKKALGGKGDGRYHAMVAPSYHNGAVGFSLACSF